MSGCNICGAPVREILSLPTLRNVTSLGKVVDATARIDVCDACSHSQTEPSVDVESWYARDYKTLSASAEEDDLYEIRGGVSVYRGAHMAEILLQKFPGLPGDVLDFGCGKSLLMKHIAAKTGKDSIYLFDVSYDYERFWEAFVPRSRTACMAIPEAWAGKFRLVTGSFSLEHVRAPGQEIRRVADLLSADGFLYLVVPNMYSANAADMLVIDHLQHYSELSMQRLLEGEGLRMIEADHRSHAQASIYVAQKQAGAPRPRVDAEAVRKWVADCEAIALFWRRAREAIREFEEALERRRVESYFIAGAGIIGTYVYLQLRRPERLVGFIDSNKFKQSKGWQGKPVLPPAAVQGSARVGVWAGLNPEQVDTVLPDLLPKGVPGENVWTLAAAL